jgi:hypothetical protein
VCGLSNNAFNKTIAYFFEFVIQRVLSLLVIPEVQKQGENKVNDYVFDCRESITYFLLSPILFLDKQADGFPTAIFMVVALQLPKNLLRE